MPAIEKTMRHIKWCNEYINEYTKAHTFDPFAALTETESKEQAIFSLCCDYLHGIETALDKASDAFKAQRNIICMGG